MLAKSYCDRNGLVLDTSTFHDHGISAFHGKNVVEGKLGVFIEAVTKGSIPKGSYLLVESLDRISRSEIDEALELFLRLIRLGLVIVTLTPPEMVYSKEQFKVDKGMSLIISLTVMMRAHEESAQKSARITASWKNKFEEAAKNGTIFSAMAPAWLSPSPDYKSWIVNKAKVKVVQQIYDLALAGNGSPTIAKMLNEKKVPVMQRAASWTFGTVNAILKNEAVIGTYVPRKHDGERIENYYPAIIEKTHFLLAREAMTQRRWVGGRGTNEGINLFSGLSWCAACGSRMRAVGTSTIKREDGETVKHLYLKCQNSYAANGMCHEGRFPYLAAERGILQHLAGELASNIDRANNPDRVDPMVVMRADLEAAQAQMEKLIDLSLTMDDPKVLAKRINDARAVIAQLNADMGKTPGPLNRVESAEFVALVDTMLGVGVKATPALRKRMQVELRRIVERVDFECDDGTGSPGIRLRFAPDYRPPNPEGVESLAVSITLGHLMQQVGGNRRKLTV